MRKRFSLLVLTVSVGLAATAGHFVLWSSVVLAAEECIKAPNLRFSQRDHWYYHTDPVSHRKCWYLGSPGVKRPQVASSESRSSPEPKRESGRLKNGQVSYQLATRLNQAARDALFQEFLQWRERQNQSSQRDEAARDTLFREFVLWQVQHTDAEHAQ